MTWPTTRADWLEHLLETNGVNLHATVVDVLLRELQTAGLVSISVGRGLGKAFHRVELTGAGRLEATGVIDQAVDEIIQQFGYKPLDCGSHCEYRAAHVAENKAELAAIIRKHLAPVAQG